MSNEPGKRKPTEKPVPFVCGYCHNVVYAAAEAKVYCEVCKERTNGSMRVRMDARPGWSGLESRD